MNMSFSADNNKRTVGLMGRVRGLQKNSFSIRWLCWGKGYKLFANMIPIVLTASSSLMLRGGHPRSAVLLLLG